jgi:hypothetical protein
MRRNSTEFPKFFWRRSSERRAADKHNKRTASPRVARACFLSWIVAGVWLRDNILVRSHHLPRQRDSGYTANSIAFTVALHNTFNDLEVNLTSLQPCLQEQYR